MLGKCCHEKKSQKEEQIIHKNQKEEQIIHKNYYLAIGNIVIVHRVNTRKQSGAA